MGRVACRSAAVIAAKPDRTSLDTGPLDRNRGWRRGRASAGRREYQRRGEGEGAQYRADDQRRASLVGLNAVAQAEEHAEEAGWQGGQQNRGAGGILVHGQKHDQPSDEQRLRHVLEQRAADHVAVEEQWLRGEDEPGEKQRHTARGLADELKASRAPSARP